MRDYEFESPATNHSQTK